MPCSERRRRHRLTGSGTSDQVERTTTATTGHELTDAMLLVWRFPTALLQNTGEIARASNRTWPLVFGSSDCPQDTNCLPRSSNGCTASRSGLYPSGPYLPTTNSRHSIHPCLNPRTENYTGTGMPGIWIDHARPVILVVTQAFL